MVVGLRSLGQQLSPALPCAQLTSLLLPCQGNNVEEPKGVTSEGSRPWPCPPSPAPASEPSPSLPLVVLEFDKFLEERAKVADRLPNLSSPSTRGSSQPRDQTCVSCIAGGFFTLSHSTAQFLLQQAFWVHFRSEGSHQA